MMTVFRTRPLAAVVIVPVFLMMLIPKADARAADKSVAGDKADGISASVSPDPAELLLRIEALDRKVGELTRVIEVLMGRNAPATVVAENPAARNETQPAAALTNASSSISPNQTAAASPNAAAAKPPASETARKDPGLLRFSGDFRLRLDGIFRPAFNSGTSDQQSLTHVQNVRGRYRLRLNIDSDIHPMVSFHAQLATGPVNNPLTLDQDFAGITARHPFQVNEAWINFHPAKWAAFQGGKVPEVFADNLRFLFDDDITFNGFNQRLTYDLDKKPAGFRRIEFRSGQYIFTNPNVAIVNSGNLGPTGAIIGSTGRASQLFHQGFLIEQGIYPHASQVFGADIQVYRNPNQIQFASTPAGVPILVQNALGLTLSGPLPGTGNATATPGGAIYTARNFEVGRLTYRFDYEGLKSARQDYPITINLQVTRNSGTGASQRDALLANIKIGRIRKAWDYSFLYLFAIKGANSMISQLTDDDLGTISGVNIRSHFFRFDLGLSKRMQLQNLFFMQNELSNSGQFPNYFVPLNAYAPRQYRFQEQILFIF